MYLWILSFLVKMQMLIKVLVTSSGKRKDASVHSCQVGKYLFLDKYCLAFELRMSNFKLTEKLTAWCGPCFFQFFLKDKTLSKLQDPSLRLGWQKEARDSSSCPSADWWLWPFWETLKNLLSLYAHQQIRENTPAHARKKDEQDK